MSDRRSRVIVDAIDLHAIAKFPLVFRQIVAALHPPRLIVALAMVLILCLAGWTWDAVRGPRHAAGALMAEPTDACRAAEAEARVAILRTWHPTTDATVDDVPDAADVLERLDRILVRWQTGAAPAEPAASGAPGDDGAASDASSGGEPSGGPEPAPAEDGAPAAAEDAAADEAEDAADAADAAAVDAAPAAPAGLEGAPDPRADRARFEADRARLAAMLPQGDFAAVRAAAADGAAEVVRGILTLRPDRSAAGVATLLVDLPVATWHRARAFAIVYGALFVIVWCIGGGALSRMAACRIATGERLPLRRAFAFVRSALVALLVAPLVPLALVVVLLVLPLVLGVAWHVPGLDVIAAILFGLAVVAAVASSCLLLGLGLGAPYIVPAIACEHCDAIDAAQRPYAYLLRRPAAMAGLSLTAVLASAAAFAIAGLVGSVALDLARHTSDAFGPTSLAVTVDGPGPLSWGQPTAPATGDATSRIAATVLAGWRFVVGLCVAAIAVSTWFSAMTAAFLLLRRACDAQDMEELWVPGLLTGTLAPPRPEPEERPDTGVRPTWRRPVDAEPASDDDGDLPQRRAPDPSPAPAPTTPTPTPQAAAVDDGAADPDRT